MSLLLAGYQFNKPITEMSGRLPSGSTGDFNRAAPGSMRSLFPGDLLGRDCDESPRVDSEKVTPEHAVCLFIFVCVSICVCVSVFMCLCVSLYMCLYVSVYPS